VAAEERDISTRVENQQDDSQFKDSRNAAASNSIVSHTGIDDIHRFYNMSLHRCKKSMTNFLSAESDAEAKARLHLIAVAETVLDPRFDIQILSQIKSRSVTKAHRANPFGFLMQCVAPDRSRQYISKLSSALCYAIQQCNHDPSKLSSFFRANSISACLREYRLLRRTEKTSAKPTAQKLVIKGAPAGLTGRIILELSVVGETATFITLIDPAQVVWSFEQDSGCGVSDVS
jgi:hypothetical protein